MGRHRFGAALLFAGALLVPARAEDPASASAAPRPGEVILRLEEGRRVEFTRTVKVRIEHKARKRTVVGQGECTTDLELVVGKRAEDGSTAVSVRAVRSRGWWDFTDEGRTTFDTSVAPVDRASRAWVIAELADPGAFSVRPDGRIVEVAESARVLPQSPGPSTRDVGTRSGAAPTASNALAEFSGTWPALPPKRMGAGTIFEDESLPPWPVSPSYLLRLRHELKVLDEQRAVIESKGAVDDLDSESSAGSPKSLRGRAAAPRVKASGFASSAEVDRADGLVRKSSARFTLVRTQPFRLEGDSVEGTGSFEWEAVMERKAAAAPAPAETPAGAPAVPTPPPAPTPAGPGDGSSKR